MDDLEKLLLDAIKLLENEPGKHPMLAFVRKIEITRTALAALRQVAVKFDKPDPPAYMGIEIASNGALPEHHALLTFGDGRMGLWDMRTSEVRVWIPTNAKW